MKHTPGHWETNLLHSMVQCEDLEICTLGVNPGKENFGYQQYSANAKLIAAAPDLLEALHRFVNYADGEKARQDEEDGWISTFESSMVLQAKAAIKKATE